MRLLPSRPALASSAAGRLAALTLAGGGGALVAALAGGCQKQDAAAAGPHGFPPAAVTVTPAEQRDVPVYLDEIGKCAAVESVMIEPQVTGKIGKIHFRDGADVKADDLLFSIDDEPFQAQLRQAEAAQTQSKAAVAFANIEYKRVQELLATKAVAQSDVDTKQNALDVANAQLKSSDAAVKIAAVNLAYCQIKSPITGRAGQRLVDAGNIVKANEAQLLSVQRLNEIYADFTITERELPAVQSSVAKAIPQKLKAWVKLPSDADRAREADLEFLDNSVQDGSGTVKMRATIAHNEDHHFWPGQFVNVKLILSHNPAAVLVPMQAVQVGQKGAFVYVIKEVPGEKPGDPKKTVGDIRPVVTGQQQGDFVVIDQGVQGGEQVIRTGQMAVIPGMPVQIVKEGGASAAGDAATPSAPVPPSGFAPTSQPGVTKPEASLGLTPTGVGRDAGSAAPAPAAGNSNDGGAKK